jgi:predicted metalloprotease with PDZ domain
LSNSQRRRFALLAILAVLLLGLAAASSASAAIRYTISIDHPERHLFSVEMQIPDVSGGVTVQMPAWNALYQIRDFSSHVRQVTASAGEKAASLEKLDKQTWRITGDGTITVRYTTYWDEPGPFASQLNSEHAFLNLAMILFYVPSRRAEGVTVTIRDVPAGWRVATALSAFDSEYARNHSAGFQAKDYDSLVDSPVEAGSFDEFDLPGFTPRIRVVVHGDNWKREHIVEVLRPICRYELDLMQDRPFDTYTFIFHIGKVTAGAGGGMEHSYSTAIFVPSEEFLTGVSAHEFFHLWNVKRIRPSSLEPVDYSKEQWTRALWFAEGVTSTYSSFTQVRSGLWSREQFYTDLGYQITDLESRAANRWKSAEESSLDSWLEKYPLYNSAESSVSYYTKGQVLGVLLDILIRDRTDNSASLDDVLRSLNTGFAQKGRTYRDSLDVRLTVEKVVGSSFEEFFRRYVAGADPLPYAEVFALAGLDLQLKKAGRASAAFAVNRGPSGEFRVTGLLPGSAAAAAGVQDGDIILQWNDGEVPRRLDRWLRQRKPGETLRLRMRRDDGEMNLEFPLDEQLEALWAVSESASAGEKARRIRDGLLRGVTQARPATSR